MGLLGRLHAWWEGYDTEQDVGEAATSARVGDRSDVVPGQVRTWTRWRVRAAQRLCGAGSSIPGGAATLADELDRLGVGDSDSVGICGAGLGEIARLMASQSAARIACVDPDAVLVEAARELVEEAELGERISFQQGDYDGKALGEQSCDAIIAREALFEAESKEDALRALHAALKPGGRILLMDFVDKSEAGATLDASVWSAFERTNPHLVAAEEYGATLTEFGYDVAEIQDIGGAYCRAILRALHEFADSLERKPVADDLRPWVMWEVEYWARRAQVLESGDIGYCAIHATAPAD